jgi:prepilin-type N-terminal cleavage/methylation domain-containing protein
MQVETQKIQKGFTLIELLVVIGILGILLAIVLIAINPAAQFAQANNTSRANDINTILNAVHQYAADNKGQLPSGIPVGDPTAEENEFKVIGSNVATQATICEDIVPDYVSLLPVDPLVNNGNGNGVAVAACEPDFQTGYEIIVDGNGRVTVRATAETVRGVTPEIVVTR